jgi:hypothetical protein
MERMDSGVIAVLQNVADWLDPLINKDWPGIDDIPDRNPCGGSH